MRKPGSNPACLFLLATSFACLLMLLTAQPGQANQRLNGGGTLSPRTDLRSEQAARTLSVKTELRKKTVLSKNQAVRLPACGDAFLPEYGISSVFPAPGRNLLSLAGTPASGHGPARPVARGPPERI